MRFLTRNWVSVALASSVLGMMVTGAIAYSSPYSEFNMGLHVIFGMLFTLGFCFHMRHNMVSLLRYFRDRPLPLGLLFGGLVVTVLVGVFFHLPPFHQIVELGRDLRGQVETETDELTVIRTDPGTTGRGLEVFVRPGPQYFSEPIPLFWGLTFRTVPQMVIWAEDADGNYLKTLYITGKAANAGWLKANPFSDEIVKRPEALPRWAHQRGFRYEDGLLMPTAENPLPDLITAATPLNSYLIQTRLPARREPTRLVLEINRSFDFNAHWHRNAFPDDPVYSGGGSSGQPALVYVAELPLPDAEDSAQTVSFRLVGHAHHSGQDGQIYPDLSGFTTALQMIDWAIVRVLPLRNNALALQTSKEIARTE